ncbi:MAG TPA: TlpA disulfide reductase family protein [Chloroflexota bacterium]|nr:TlpA disulfide reductase family protein [Chloroflexota bacterium]
MLRHVPLLLLLTGLLGGACAPALQPAAGPALAPPSAPAAPASDLAPELTVETLDGRLWRLSEHRGQPVVLFFTASWCSSCLPEIATLNRLYALYRDQGLQVVVISVDPSDTAADFLRFKQLAQGDDYVWGLDRGGQATIAYQVKMLETKVVVGRDGRVVARHVGREPFEAAKAAIESAL